MGGTPGGPEILVSKDTGRCGGGDRRGGEGVRGGWGERIFCLDLSVESVDLVHAPALVVPPRQEEGCAHHNPEQARLLHLRIGM